MAYSYDSKETTCAALSGGAKTGLSLAATGPGIGAVAGSAFPVLGTVIGAGIGAGVGLIAGAIQGRGESRKSQRLEQDAATQQAAYDQSVATNADKASYDASQMSALNAAAAAKSARRSKIPADPDLQAAMYTGSGTSYDAWHGQVYGQ